MKNNTIGSIEGLVKGLVSWSLIASVGYSGVVNIWRVWTNVEYPAFTFANAEQIAKKSISPFARTLFAIAAIFAVSYSWQKSTEKSRQKTTPMTFALIIDLLAIIPVNALAPGSAELANWLLIIAAYPLSKIEDSVESNMIVQEDNKLKKDVAKLVPQAVPFSDLITTDTEYAKQFNIAERGILLAMYKEASQEMLKTRRHGAFRVERDFPTEVGQRLATIVTFLMNNPEYVFNFDVAHAESAMQMLEKHIAAAATELGDIPEIDKWTPALYAEIVQFLLNQAYKFTKAGQTCYSQGSYEAAKKAYDMVSGNGVWLTKAVIQLWTVEEDAKKWHQQQAAEQVKLRQLQSARDIGIELPEQVDFPTL